MDDRFIVPMFSLVVGGISIDADTVKLIDNIELREVSNGSNELNISIQDPDFIYLGGSLFAQETPVYYELTLMNAGYTRVFDGYVSAVDINFPENGVPKLEIMCMDITHVMNRVKKYEKFDEMSRSDIAQKIASSYGFKCVVDASSGDVEESITQSNQTDIVFIQQLAAQESEDYIVYVQGNTFYYKKRDTSGSAQMSLHYRQASYDVRSFKPNVNIEEIKEETSDENISNEGKKVSGNSTPVKPSGGGATSSGSGGSQGSSSPGADLINWIYDYESGEFNKVVTKPGESVPRYSATYGGPVKR